MDTFRDITPDEAKLITLQFLGQNVLGEIKEIDKNIIDRNSSLRSMAVKPQDILNTIPGTTITPPAAVQAGRTLSIQPAMQPQQPAPAAQEDSNQLMFNFDNSATAQKIFDHIDIILRKIESLETLILKTTQK